MSEPFEHMTLTKTQEQALMEMWDAGLVVIVWTPADVADIRPDWPEETCAVALADVSRDLEGRSIEYGWALLEAMLPPADA